VAGEDAAVADAAEATEAMDAVLGDEGGRERAPDLVLEEAGAEVAVSVGTGTGTGKTVLWSQGTGATERGTGAGAVGPAVVGGVIPAVTVTMTWRIPFWAETAPAMSTACKTLYNCIVECLLLPVFE
jgi:hypothetical protein